MALPKHILVIRLSAMGDVAMTVPVLRAFTTQYPEVRITVLSRKFFKPLFLELPNVSFWEADVTGKHKGFFGLQRLAKTLNAQDFDAVADLHFVLRSRMISFYLKLFGKRVCSLDKGRGEKKLLTQSKGGILNPLKSTHERYADVFRKLGFDLSLESPSFPKRKSLAPKLLTFVGKTPKKLIGIAPFAAYKSKMYPLELMQEVLKELNERGKHQVLLFGGGAEETLQLERWDSMYDHVTSVANRLSFEEELSLISNLDIMLSMDSGNGHLAANFGIPVLTLWGVTHPYLGFQPFAQPFGNQVLSNREEFPLIPTSVYGNTYPEGYENVMKTIPPSEVISKIEQLLA